jgi:uncharacterized membrane protein YgcG
MGVVRSSIRHEPARPVSRVTKLVALAALLLALGALVLGATASTVVAAGPPYPEPVPGQRVYDTAGVFSQATIASAEQTIAAIKERTGVEIVVYAQVKPESDTPALAEADADALGTQWGVGEKGFDNGLVILFDLDNSLRHGQVQLDGAEGYKAVYLSQSDLQRIYDNDMLPLLKDGDLDGALLVALQRIDAGTTAESAARLRLARQVDAAVGLVGAPIVLLLLVGWGAWSWQRFGRDPVYLDDPSIHIPAPPPDLTPASGALVYDGHSSRRTLTTAMVDLASRGLLSFHEEKSGLLGIGKPKLGIDIGAAAPGDAKAAFERTTAARQPIGPAEEYAYDQLSAIAVDGVVEPDKLLEFGTKVSTFNERLERHVAAKGWFTEPPYKVTRRWMARGIVVAIVGGVGIFAGANVPSNGLLLLGIAGLAGGLALIGIARVMPARTMPGAMIQAMLAAYRRTLDKTMAQARSMDQVVAEANLPWLTSPDRAVVWGVALGLQSRVEEVLARSLEDLREARTTSAYLPVWYAAGSSGGHAFAGAGSGGGGGVFSSSAIPNFGGMMAALGTIGNAPSSSGGGGGGGFGGGGGGAGGGF